MYEFDSRIRYSETDPDGVLTIESLIDYFQDCSTFQTQHVGAGLDYLKERHLIWILNAWQIDIDRMPRLYENVTVGTIPYLLKGFTGQRNFYMMGKDGSFCARANSLWTLFDLQTMYPSRITKEHEERYEIGEKIDMEYLGRKITLPQTEGVAGDPVIIHRHHLDSNGHVNNGQFIRIALDATEAADIKGFDPARIKRLRAEYKKQVFIGDYLTPVIFHGQSEEGREAVTVDLRMEDTSCCVVALS